MPLIADVSEENTAALEEVAKLGLVKIEAELLATAVDDMLFNVVLVMLSALKSEVDVIVEVEGLSSDVGKVDVKAAIVADVASLDKRVDA